MTQQDRDNYYSTDDGEFDHPSNVISLCDYRREKFIRAGEAQRTYTEPRVSASDLIEDILADMEYDNA